MTVTTTSGGIEVASSLAEVEALRSAWQAAGVRDVDSDIDYFLTVARISSSVIRPHVVRLRRPDQRDLFGIARIEDYELPLRIARRTLAAPRLRAVVVTFGGLVGVETPEDAESLIDALREPVRRGEADALVLRDLEVGGPVLATAHRLAAGSRVWGMPVKRRWLAQRPKSLDDFVSQQSPSSRKGMRRCLRQLDAGKAGVPRLRRVSTPQDGDGLVEDLERVAARSYQRQLGVGFAAHALTEALVRIGLEKGWFRAWVLYLDERPVAYWCGIRYAGEFGRGTTAFDAAQHRHGVGQYAMLRMVEDVAADDGISLLNLGHGDFDYKQRFTCRIVEEKDVIMVAPRAHPVVLAGIESALVVVNRLGKAVLSRRIQDRVARRRRGGPGGREGRPGGIVDRG